MKQYNRNKALMRDALYYGILDNTVKLHYITDENERDRIRAMIRCIRYVRDRINICNSFNQLRSDIDKQCKSATHNEYISYGEIWDKIYNFMKGDFHK